MTTSDETTRRIASARELCGFLASMGSVDDADHRVLATHERIVQAIESICANHQGADSFTPTQVECLKEIAFQITFVMDPNNKPPGRIRKIRNDLKQASWVVKIPIIIALVSLIGGVFGWFFGFFHLEQAPTHQQSNSQAPGTTQIPPTSSNQSPSATTIQPPSANQTPAATLSRAPSSNQVPSATPPLDIRPQNQSRSKP
jgi:hypothetical protein